MFQSLSLEQQLVARSQYLACCQCPLALYQPLSAQELLHIVERSFEFQLTRGNGKITFSGNVITSPCCYAHCLRDCLPIVSIALLETRCGVHPWQHLYQHIQHVLQITYSGMNVPNKQSKPCSTASQCFVLFEGFFLRTTIG